MAICMSFLEKCLFRYFCHLKVASFFYYCVCFLYFIYESIARYGLEIFCTILWSFTFLTVSFEAKKFLIFMKSNLSISTFISCGFVAMSKNPLPNPRSWRFAAMFSSKSFIVLTLTFRSLIPFKLIFYMMWVKTTTSFLCVDLPSCPSTICWQYCSLPHWMILDPC